MKTADLHLFLIHEQYDGYVLRLHVLFEAVVEVDDLEILGLGIQDDEVRILFHNGVDRDAVLGHEKSAEMCLFLERLFELR